ncbi:MAG: hypothetical protein RSB58_09270 [Clostridium sp.]
MSRTVGLVFKKERNKKSQGKGDDAKNSTAVQSVEIKEPPKLPEKSD